MTVTIKSLEEQEKMRVAGRLAADVLDMIGEYVKPGVSTSELNDICHDFIVNEQRAIPAPLNYRGFPKSICTSVNHVVCHGIPGDRKLKNGDMVNIDITVIKDGYHGDTSRMFHVGKPSVIGRRLSEIAKDSMWKGIETGTPGSDSRGYRPRCSVLRGIPSLLRSPRILRARDRHDFSRGPADPALREAQHRTRSSGRYDLYHRADGERRQT